MKRLILIVLVLMVIAVGFYLGYKQATQVKPWEQAKNKAIQSINTREEWPATPEEVCKAFWNARRTKNYLEMAFLWPGSDSHNWEEICKNEPEVKYVFGEANETKTEVPYATEEDFKKYGSYNLTMKMSSFESQKGRRYYIVSGN
jgi:hypothetical protein